MEVIQIHLPCFTSCNVNKQFVNKNTFSISADNQFHDYQSCECILRFMVNTSEYVCDVLGCYLASKLHENSSIKQSFGIHEASNVKQIFLRMKIRKYWRSNSLNKQQSLDHEISNHDESRLEFAILTEIFSRNLFATSTVLFHSKSSECDLILYRFCLNNLIISKHSWLFILFLLISSY